MCVLSLLRVAGRVCRGRAYLAASADRSLPQPLAALVASAMIMSRLMIMIMGVTPDHDRTDYDSPPSVVPRLRRLRQTLPARPERRKGGWVFT